VFGIRLLLFNVNHLSCSLHNTWQVLIIVYTSLLKAIHRNKVIIAVSKTVDQGLLL